LPLDPLALSGWRPSPIPGLVLNPGFGRLKPPVCDLPHRPPPYPPPLAGEGREGASDATLLMPCPFEPTRHQRTQRQSLEVRTVAGLPPNPIFTRLCRYLSLSTTQASELSPCAMRGRLQSRTGPHPAPPDGRAPSSKQIEIPLPFLSEVSNRTSDKEKFPDHQFC